MTSEDQTPTFQSMLTNYPEFVHAIGMIAIEQANIEFQLADLLGAILRVHNDVAHAIYFTPRTVIPRVDVLANVAAALHPDPEINMAAFRKIQKRIENVTKRAIKAMGKRNALLHAAWGTDQNATGVHYSPLPMKEGSLRPADIDDLHHMVVSMRRLISDISRLQDDVIELHTASLENSE